LFLFVVFGIYFIRGVFSRTNIGSKAKCGLRSTANRMKMSTEPEHNTSVDKPAISSANGNLRLTSPTIVATSII